MAQGNYAELAKRAAELGKIIHNEDDVLGLLHAIKNKPQVSGGRKEELVEFLIHLLACKRVCMNNKLLGKARSLENDEFPEINEQEA